jgi:hypothetical protein
LPASGAVTLRRFAGCGWRLRRATAYRVSLCGVWRAHQRQYFENSILSGEFRFDLFVW